MALEFKIILLGESGVGKTSLIHTYSTGHFNTNRNVTRVVNLISKELFLKGRRIKLCIWDTSSKEFFKNVVSNYYDGCLLVYDATDENTFNALSDWWKLLRKKNDGTPAIVVGNKIDLLDGKKDASHDDTRKFTDDEHIECMESSAKNGDNVVDIFENLTLKILEAKKLGSNEEVSCESSISSYIPSSYDDTISDVSSIIKFPDNESGIEQEALNNDDQLQEANPGTLELPLKPDVQILPNNAHEHEAAENLQPTLLNGDSNPSQEDDDDVEDIEQSFVFVSFLPPIVPLPDDVPLLHVGRRRTSADSVLSLMTESEINNVKLRAQMRTQETSCL